MTSQSNMPLVSIIALCYNQARFAVETLESIRNQTYQNIELVIMDDCSSDDSVNVIENWIQETQYPCTFIKHDKNQGICKTLNEALSHCTGQYLQMIACDDIMLPEKTTIQVELLNKQVESVAVVYSDAFLINDDGSPHYGWFIQRFRQFSEVPSGDIYNALLSGNFIPAMTTLIKTEVIRKIGRWDENLSYEDYDFWLRIAQRYEFVFSQYVSVKYRLHPNNTSRSINWADSQFWIYSKHTENPKAKDELYRWFWELYSNNNATKNHKNVYLNNFKNGFTSALIRAGISYKIYKTIISIKNIFFR